MPPIIQTTALTKYYGKQRGIENLTLEVQKGEIFGFLGPNGAGKTTTIRTLLDFIRPTSGSAVMLGMDTHDHSLEIRSRAGYLPGELSLYPSLNGTQTVKYLGSLRGGIEWDWVHRLAKRLDLDMERSVQALSSGNKQKLGLLLALMDRAELILLDEPTKGLDPLMQQTFYELMKELRNGGSTIFLSSHILPEVERICDRVAIIREGFLVKVESIAALKSKALRRLEFHFENKVDPGTFRNLTGVVSVEAANNRLTCTVRGTLDAVVKAAAEHTVLNLISHEPSLEEVFLSYYRGESNHVE